MSSNDDSQNDYPEGDYRPYKPTRRRWTADAELRQARLADQIRIIQEALPDAEAHIGVDRGDDPNAAPSVQYLYRRDRLLVRDADLARVDRALGFDPATIDTRVVTGTTDDGRPVSINGLTAYIVQGRSALEALDLLDATEGVGVGTLDHVLWITGGAGCCPDTEPEPPGRRSPVPGRNWKQSTSGRGVSVSVVDTGWLPAVANDGRHPWLQGVTGDREDYNSGAIRHYVGHGTFIAGIVRCLAPEADVRVEGFLPVGGAIYESEIVRQLNESLDRVPDIISLSAGAWTRNTLPLLSFEVFWETRLRHLKGTVLVAAAGNDGNRGPFWPAAYPWALSVGALNATGTARADYSNFGSWVDVYARGSDIVNAFPDGRYTYDEAPHRGEVYQFVEGLAKWSGTSFSTPIVAGLIAGRMSRTGESARDAADALKKLAVANAKPGVGPILRPGMASQS